MIVMEEKAFCKVWYCDEYGEEIAVFPHDFGKLTGDSFISVHAVLIYDDKFTELGDRLLGTTSVDGLVAIVRFLYQLEDYQKDEFLAVDEYVMSDEFGLDYSISNTITLFVHGNYTFYPNCSNYKEVAEEVLNDSGINESDFAWLQEFLDLEALGKSTMTDYSSLFTKYGAIVMY